MDTWKAVLPAPTGLDDLIMYLVDTADGPVGVLTDVDHDAAGDPTALLVRQGWFGRQTVRVPVDAIVGVNHRSGRIILARGSAPLEPSRWLRFFT